MVYNLNLFNKNITSLVKSISMIRYFENHIKYINSIKITFYKYLKKESYFFSMNIQSMSLERAKYLYEKKHNYKNKNQYKNKLQLE